MKHSFSYFLSFALFVSLFPLSTMGQAPSQDRLALEKAELTRPVLKGLDHGKKLGGRLPNGYRAVVSNSQRDEIYDVQKDYAHLIELLKLRIALLERERDQKVDALLTKEQVATIRKERGMLHSERQNQKAGTATSDAEPAAAPPATPPAAEQETAAPPVAEPTATAEE